MILTDDEQKNNLVISFPLLFFGSLWMGLLAERILRVCGGNLGGVSVCFFLIFSFPFPFPSFCCIPHLRLHLRGVLLFLFSHFSFNCKVKICALLCQMWQTGRKESSVQCVHFFSFASLSLTLSGGRMIKRYGFFLSLFLC